MRALYFVHIWQMWQLQNCLAHFFVCWWRDFFLQEIWHLGSWKRRRRLLLGGKYKISVLRVCEPARCNSSERASEYNIQELRLLALLFSLVFRRRRDSSDPSQPHFRLLEWKKDLNVIWNLPAPVVFSISEINISLPRHTRTGGRWQSSLLEPHKQPTVKAALFCNNITHPQVTAAFALALLRAHFSPSQFLSAATRWASASVCLQKIMKSLQPAQE